MCTSIALSHSQTGNALAQPTLAAVDMSNDLVGLFLINENLRGYGFLTLYDLEEKIFSG